MRNIVEVRIQKRSVFGCQTRFLYNYPYYEISIEWVVGTQPALPQAALHATPAEVDFADEFDENGFLCVDSPVRKFRIQPTSWHTISIGLSEKDLGYYALSANLLIGVEAESVLRGIYFQPVGT